MYQSWMNQVVLVVEPAVNSCQRQRDENLSQLSAKWIVIQNKSPTIRLAKNYCCFLNAKNIWWKLFLIIWTAVHLGAASKVETSNIPGIADVQLALSESKWLVSTRTKQNRIHQIACSTHMGCVCIYIVDPLWLFPLSNFNPIHPSFTKLQSRGTIFYIIHFLILLNH